MCKHFFFFKTNLFKEEMKKFVLLTKEKHLRMNGKMISLTLYSAYKISTILFFLLVNLFKQRGISSVKL